MSTQNISRRIRPGKIASYACKASARRGSEHNTPIVYDSYNEEARQQTDEPVNCSQHHSEDKIGVDAAWNLQ